MASFRQQESSTAPGRFGADRSTLYVTSARENLTEEQLHAHPLSGSVFAVETDTAGRPPNVFGCDG